MDVWALVIGFGLGLAAGVVVAIRMLRRGQSRDRTQAIRAARLRRIDATEAYVTTTVAWLFGRAFGAWRPVAALDAEVAGARYGQVETRLLSEEDALEYAAICRLLWASAAPSAAAAQGPVEERVVAFRARLREHLDRQRQLAEDGEAPWLLPKDAAEVLSQLIDEVVHFRTAQLEQVRGVDSGSRRPAQ